MTVAILLCTRSSWLSLKTMSQCRLVRHKSNLAASQIKLAGSCVLTYRSCDPRVNLSRMIAENTSTFHLVRFCFFSCFHSVGYDLWQGLTTQPLPVSLLYWKPGGNVAVWNPFWQIWKEKGVLSGIFYHELVKSWLCSGSWILHLYLSTYDHLNRGSRAGSFLCVVHGGHRLLLS